MLITQVTLTEPSLSPSQHAILSDTQADLVLLFASPVLLRNTTFIAQLHTLIQQAPRTPPLIGCSTAGEIAGTTVYEKSAVITLIRFEQDTQVHIASTALPKMRDSYQAGQTLGSSLQSHTTSPSLPLSAIWIMAPGLDINGSALINGLADVIGYEVPISGGLAGDDGAFLKTETLSDHGLDSRTVVAVGFYGSRLCFSRGSAGGWRSFGPRRQVTRSQDNVLYELDGQPALEIYRRYLGDYAKDLPASGLLFPFEMLDANDGTLGTVRTILAIDAAQGSLILAGNIEEGCYLKLMHAMSDHLIEGAERSVQRALQPLSNMSWLSSQPVSPHSQSIDERPATGHALALLVSCVGRKLVMGDQVEEEIEVIADQLPQHVCIAGFYSYGEIGPLANGQQCKLHNQTMTLSILTEWPL